MPTAALIAWVVTAAGGLLMAGIWIAKGGLRREAEPARRAGPGVSQPEREPSPPTSSHLPIWRVVVHAAIAVAGLILFSVYVGTDDPEETGYNAAPWIALGLLVVVAAIGLSMAARWKRDRDELSDRRGATDVPAEQHIPVAVVAGHGLAAAATMVLVLLVALGVG